MKINTYVPVPKLPIPSNSWHGDIHHYIITIVRLPRLAVVYLLTASHIQEMKRWASNGSDPTFVVLAGQRGLFSCESETDRQSERLGPATDGEFHYHC